MTLDERAAWPQSPIGKNKIEYSCCVFQPGNACLGIHSHDQKRRKTLENLEKVPFPS